MKRSVLFAALALTTALGLSVGQLLSKDAKKPAKPTKPQADDSYAAMMKIGAPGPHHKHLNVLAGNWKAKAKFWMDPSKEPDESEGVVVRKWILGGRFLEEKYDGKAAGMPFKGLGLVGYDNAKKKYTSMWVDSMSTKIETSFGTYDAAKKTFTFTSEGDDPYSGMKMKSRDVTRLISDDEQIVQMYRKPAKGGPEFKVLEIVYTRKK